MEHKFRAWHNISKEMLYDTPRNIFFWQSEKQPIEIMQQLDIKDIWGAYYFFNDIVRTPQGIGVLVWFDDRLGISSGEINNYHATDSISKEELEQSEILGNIYEHNHILS